MSAALLREHLKAALWASILNRQDGAGSDLVVADPDHEGVSIDVEGPLDVEHLVSEVCAVLERSGIHVRTDREGWGYIRPGDRKAHYYRGGTSLCGRVGFYFSDVEPDAKPSSDDCAACRKELEAEKGRRRQIG